MHLKNKVAINGDTYTILKKYTKGPTSTRNKSSFDQNMLNRFMVGPGLMWIKKREEGQRGSLCCYLLIKQQRTDSM